MYLSQFDQIFLVSYVFMTFLLHVSAQNLQSELFDLAKELAFRKSGYGVHFTFMYQTLVTLVLCINSILISASPSKQPFGRESENFS